MLTLLNVHLGTVGCQNIDRFSEYVLNTTEKVEKMTHFSHCLKTPLKNLLEAINHRTLSAYSQEHQAGFHGSNANNYFDMIKNADVRCD